MNRFSEVVEVPFPTIHVAPEYFQGRQTDFSSDTVDAILRKGFYDKTGEPLIVWTEDTDKHIVISGHSRYEAIRQLFQSGRQPDLNRVPVKIFRGTKDEAIDYAVLESNRGTSQEGLISDLKAYKRALERGKNRTYLLSIFKPESRLNKLQQLSYLNDKGQFVTQLAGTSSLSFPYLERNATWVGNMRKQLPQLTDAHENEIFEYIYKGKGLSLKKDKLFDLVSKRVNRIDFDADKALNLADRISTNALTDPLQEQIKDLDKQIARANREIETKRNAIVRSRQDEVGKDQIPVLQARIKELNGYILRMIEQRETIRQRIGKVERTQTVDLFSQEPELKKQGQDIPKLKDSKLALMRMRARALKLKMALGIEKKPEPKKLDRFSKEYREQQRKLPWYERNRAMPTGKYFMGGEVPDEVYAKWSKPLEIPKDLTEEFDRLQKVASRAWDGVSFSPEKRGRSFLKDTIKQLDQYSKEVGEATKAPGSEKIDRELVNDFRKKYISKALEYANAQSNTISSMITGPARFPVRKAENANNRERRVSQELSELPGKFIKRVERERKRNARKEAAEAGAFTLENQLKQQRLLFKQMEDEQKRVMAANKIVAKGLKTGNEDGTAFALAELGYSSDLALKAMQARQAYNGKILNKFGMYASKKRADVKKQIAALEKQIAKGPIPDQQYFDGGYAVRNQVDDRLQLIFDDKPNEDLRTALKRNGYRWSPRNKAWQRQLTFNAERSFEMLIDNGIIKPLETSGNNSENQKLTDEEWANVPKKVKDYIHANFPLDKVSVKRERDSRTKARRLHITSLNNDGNDPLSLKLQKFLYVVTGSPKTVHNKATSAYGGLIDMYFVYTYLLPLMEQYPQWDKYNKRIDIPWMKMKFGPAV